MTAYRILQFRHDAPVDVRFRSLDQVQTVNLAHYYQTYSGEIHLHDAIPHDVSVLESLFHEFNLHHPADFRSYSLSVGDIIVIDNERMYFCDMFGWTPLTADMVEGDLPGDED